MHIGIPILAIFHSCGGMERSGIYLATAMMQRGHQVTIFYTEPKNPSDPPLYPLPKGAQLVALSGQLQSPSLVEETRKKIVDSGIDVLIGLMFGTDMIRLPIALIGTGIPLVVSERNVPEISEDEWDPAVRRACMAAADRIHILSNSFKSGFPTYLRDRISVIPNFTAQKECFVPSQQNNDTRKMLLGVGRLDEKHKQFSLLIRAFASLSEKYPDWDLTICGSGKKRIWNRYHKIASTLGVKERVFMPGRITDVDSYYRKSHLFCIPSRYEAFGLVTTEAYSHGLPVVGFAECAGTNEIIVPEENGLLADKMTARSLAQKLDILMGDATLRQSMGQRGWEMLDRYNEEAVFDQWEILLRQVAEAKGNTALQKMAAGSLEAEWSVLSALAARPVLFKRPSKYEKIKKKLRKTFRHFMRKI